MNSSKAKQRTRKVTVSKNESQSLKGEELVREIVDSTGLPSEVIEEELLDILSESGECNKELTLEGLRKAMLNYLESLNQDMEASQGDNQNSQNSLKH